jgi:hypothetical protein
MSTQALRPSNLVLQILPKLRSVNRIHDSKRGFFAAEPHIQDIRPAEMTFFLRLSPISHAIDKLLCRCVNSRGFTSQYPHGCATRSCVDLRPFSIKLALAPRASLTGATPRGSATPKKSGPLIFFLKVTP